MRVFISYSLQDQEKIQRIADVLLNAGHQVIGMRSRPSQGDDIFKFIQSNINSADVFILAISENSLKSQWVLKEFSFVALKELRHRKVGIISVLLDKVTAPGYLSNHLTLDLSIDFKVGLQHLISALGQTENTKSSNIQAREITQENHENQIFELRNALRAGRLTLVCGAGVSVDAGIPVWSELLLKLLKSMIDRLSNNHSLDLGENAAEEFNKKHGANSLILGKYLKNNLADDFSKEIRDAIYSDNPKSCDLIDAIVELSRPQRDGKPLDSIVTFNFDALIEENLHVRNVSNRAIYSEAIKHDPNELPIYHVHGFLPRTGDVPHDTDIVFSEDSYHSQFIDPFSWSNLIQLNKLTQNTCLLVGISLTDPNLRRLLDVSWRKSPDKKVGHYVIKKLPGFGQSDAVLSNLAKLLEEQDANALGINVIWVKEYSEIPQILRAIRAAGV